MENNETDPPDPIIVYKKQEFECYVLWRSLPSIYRGQPRHVLEKMGIDDEISMSMLEIKNQTEFAKRFGIKDLGTLSAWNKKIDERGGLMRDIYPWARRHTPNVVAALGREATKTGKAAEFRAWMEYVEDR